MLTDTTTPTLRAYRIRCPVCHAEPRNACKGIDARLVHTERAKAAR